MEKSQVQGKGYLNLLNSFKDAGIESPPIPEELRPQLIMQDTWCWATRPIDHYEMYMGAHPYIEELFEKSVENYAAVSHAGHGLNSSGLQFNLVFGPVAIIIQNSYGGVYMDENITARSIAATYTHIRNLIDCISPLETGRIDDRVVIVWSEFRGINQYSIVKGVEHAPHHTPDNTSKIIWEHLDDWSGMGWCPASREDGSKIFWKHFELQEDLFMAATEELLRMQGEV